MKTIFLPIMLVFILNLSCTRWKIEKDTPKCIKNKIVKFKRNQSCDDIRVNEYTFQGTTVFVFEAGTCGADMSSEVLDSDCNSLGALGGLAGNGVINGENFSNAIFVKTVWNK